MREPKSSWLWTGRRLSAIGDSPGDNGLAQFSLSHQYQSQSPEVNMIIVTYLADDNARKRRRARRNAQREQAMQDASLARRVANSTCSTRVTKAISLSGTRQKVVEGGAVCLPEVALFAAGHRKSKQVTAR